jgi:hypothetical protein
VNVDAVLKRQEAAKIFHITTRKFGDSEPSHYVSPQLSTLSIQALIWILRSIRKDEMTPNEKLVLSRIKECYGMKINQLYWNGIMLYLKSIADINGDLIFKEPALTNMRIKKARDLLNNTEYYLIYLKDNVDWVSSDAGPISVEDT